MSIDQLDPTALRRAFGACPSGVVSVCATDGDGLPVGMVVSTFIPVSLDPPLVAFSLRAQSRTWPVLRSRPRLGLSVLTASHSRAAGQLAAAEGDRFGGLDLVTSERGAVFIAGAAIQFECVVDQEFRAGDHDLVTLAVQSMLVAERTEVPLVFHHSGFMTTGPLPDVALVSA